MEYEEIIKGIQEKGVYTFLVENYYKLSQEDLKDIAKEIDYILEPNREKEEEIIQALKEWWAI